MLISYDFLLKKIIVRFNLNGQTKNISNVS